MLPELIQEGLWRIPLQMRLNPPFVNVYLLRAPEGWLLIDTGPPGEGTWAELTEALAGCGVAPDQIKALIHTHAHPDHVGQADALRALTGAPVWLHPADAAMLREIHAGLPDIADVVRLAGTPESMWPDAQESHRKLLSHFPALTHDHDLLESTTFETVLGTMRVLHTPGHCPGHCCLVAGGVVFSGDHVLPDTLPHAGFIPGQDTVGDYLATIPRLRELEVRLVLPSHGLPFDGWRAWLDRAEATHLKRMARVADLRSKGLNAHQMVQTMWQRELRPVDYQLALTRVLGYLRHLDATR